jgi:3-isopropylmalate/(R)-2-methylmalate dehydratase small subunit
MNWIFKNNINTDLITPGRYNMVTDPKELAKISFIEYRPDFVKQVKKNDFVIAGRNFGCGSSRETAVTALRENQIKALIAKSFARIFYRNCLNGGLLAIEAKTDKIDKNDRLEIDIKNQQLNNLTKKQSQKIKIPKAMLILNKSKGITNYLKQNGLNSIKNLF